jgi:tellurite resistance protein TerC
MQSLHTTTWIVFGTVILALLAVDLWVHRGERADDRRTAILWTVAWIVAGLGFGGYVWARMGTDLAQEYLAAYLIEKSLSLDNLFVFLIIFQSLNIPRQFQHTVLFWGIFGALIFRALFVFIGSAALQRWEWLSFLFGAVLIWAAWRVFRENPAEKTENEAVRWLSRHVPVTDETRSKAFVANVDGRRVATPLLIALVAIELSDIVFAFDSVPAAFAMSRHPFIVYSSNAFAILGLRSLYLVLAHTIAELKELHYGLALVLGFAGVKIVLEQWVHVPALLSVGVIAAVLGVTVWTSLRRRKQAHGRGRRQTSFASDRPAHQEP